MLKYVVYCCSWLQFMMLAARGERWVDLSRVRFLFQAFFNVRCSSVVEAQITLGIVNNVCLCGKLKLGWCAPWVLAVLQPSNNCNCYSRTRVQQSSRLLRRHIVKRRLFVHKRVYNFGSFNSISSVLRGAVTSTYARIEPRGAVGLVRRSFALRTICDAKFPAPLTRVDGPPRCINKKVGRQEFCRF